MKLNIPFKTKFKITYDKTNIDYYSDEEIAKKLFQDLLNASQKRCMYCGESLETLSGFFKTLNMEGVTFDREHGVERKIEKSICITKLTQCKFNFGIACHTCNDKKRIKVKVDKSLLEKLNNKTCESECKKPCEEYTNVLSAYKKENLIMVMPTGLNSDHDIIYDTENLIFSINNDHSHDSTSKKIINNHIEKFLSPSQKKCLDDIISEIGENYHTLPEKKTISNLHKYKSIVAETFIDVLSPLSPNQRKIIVSSIKRKILRSNGIPI